MKQSLTILSLLLANNVSAFIHLHMASPFHAASPFCSATVDAVELVEDSSDSTLTEQPKFKYETTVISDPKFKVGEVSKDLSVENDPKKRVQTGRYNGKQNSIAVPFLKRPSKLDGTHAGDVGFDPLGLSENLDLYAMMEAELRHARLAMLAVVGWPLSELNGPNFMLHGPSHLAPSVLNGFDPLSFIAVAGIFGAFGYFEYKTSLRRVDDKPLGIKHMADMTNVWKYGTPGDYNFDPFNLYSMFGDTADGRKAVRELEIAHGRGAMVGITVFALWEALTGHPIVENNLLFQPNAIVPLLAALYFGFGFFYEIKNTDQYLLQIEQTSEGAVRMENIKTQAKNAQKEASHYGDIALINATKYGRIAIDSANDVKEKYDKLTVEYTKSVMSKNYDV